MKNSTNKKIAELPQYYNRFDESHGFDETLFLAGRGLQSAELNELQSAGFSRIQGIGDALFQEGDVISGAQCVIDGETGDATIESGKVYLQGAVRLVDAAQLTIPLKGVVQLGVCLQTSVVTELDDPTLRDPALGCRNYQEAGAARLRRTTAWTYELIEALDLEEENNNTLQEENDTPENNVPLKNNGVENNPDNENNLNEDDKHTSHFYPIYRVVNGVLVQHNAPPQSDALEKSLARYDHDSHGHYVIDGLNVRLLPAETNTIIDNDPAATDDNDNDGNHSNWLQTVMVSEGKAHVNGFTVQFSHPVLVDFPVELDVADVLAEPHPFVPDSTGKMTIKLHHTPVAAINRVEITREKTVTVTHGADAGAVDALPDTVVISVLRITQGTVVFRPNTDYRFEAGRINWSIGGKTPLSGSQYTVLCQVRESVTPESVTENRFSVRGAVKDSLVLVDYARYLPRIDAIVLNDKGTIQRLKGTSSESTQPIAPIIPAEVFALAFIHQTGSRLSPLVVENSAVQCISMAELMKLRDGLQDLYAKVAELTLGNAASQETPAIKKGLLVDAFLNESVRDAGVAQTAAILEGCLTLPILESGMTVTAVDAQPTETTLGTNESRWQLPFVLEACGDEPLQTDYVRLSAGRLVPGQVWLSPAVDRWTIPAEGDLLTVNSASFWTRRFSPRSTEFQSATNASGNDYSRPLLTQARGGVVHFYAQGFWTGGELTVSVNGQSVNSKSTPFFIDRGLNTKVGEFTLPDSLPSGCQRIEFRSVTSACTVQMNYWVREVVTAQERRVIAQAWDDQHSRWSGIRLGAMIQTFALDTDQFIGGVELWVRYTKMRYPFMVELREVCEGKVGANIFAKSVVRLPQATMDGKTPIRITWPPVWVEAHREYALVVDCFEGNGEIATAQIGKWDRFHRRSVRAVNVNGGSFFRYERAYPDYCLTYRLLAARFTKTANDINLGQVTLKEASNVILLVNADRVTPSTQCRFYLSNTQVNQPTYSLTENAPVALPDSVSGTFEVRAHLMGTATESPVIYSGIQFAQARLSQSGDYVTRLITAGSNSHVTITYEADLGDDTDTAHHGTVEAWVETATNHFQTAALQSTRDIEKNWVERVHTFSPLNRTETRIKLVLQGNAKCRTKVRRLRVVIT